MSTNCEDPEVEYYNSMTDHMLWSEGLMDLKDTWFAKRIAGYTQDVREGKYGELVQEWSEFDGWGDGLKVPVMAIVRNGKGIQVKVAESGVFEKMKHGGSMLIQPIYT